MLHDSGSVDRRAGTQNCILAWTHCGDFAQRSCALRNTANHAADFFDCMSRSAVLDGSLSNNEAWQHGRLLRIGHESYVVDRNPPTIEKVCSEVRMLLQREAARSIPQLCRCLRLSVTHGVLVTLTATCLQLEVHGKAIVGCPVLAMATVREPPVDQPVATLPAMPCHQNAHQQTTPTWPADGNVVAGGLNQSLCARGVPTVKSPPFGALQMKFASSEASQWAWHRRPPTASGFTPLAAHDRRYVPQAADVGCMLRVECTPAAQIPAGLAFLLSKDAHLHTMVDLDEIDVAADATGALPCLTVHLHAGSVSSDDCSNGHDTNGAVHEAQQLRLGDPEAFTFGPVEAGPGADTPTSRRHALTGVRFLIV